MKINEQKTGLLLILPSILLILALLVYPVAYGVWLSFFKKHSFFPEQRFVGLANYIYLLKNPEFWMSVWYGTVYSVSTICLQVIVGVIAALIVNESFKGRNFVRGVILFPYVIPAVVAIILWKWLLNNQFGLVNYILVSIGITEQPISWMGKDHIMTSLIIISVWEFFPFVVLSVLARMQSIPPALYEAAKVDGAGAFRRFFHVTLPQLRNVLFVVILLRSIWMFTKFDTVWLLTQGGGAEKYIRTLPVYAYMRTFMYYQAGLGSTLAVIMFLILVGFTMIYFKMFRREEGI
ncbi:MAG: sugar ABC transporter permease [Deltaproteobacteria bacterium]|nr:sugar ABC transporter permease [Deltaproteobacteria bacterium]MBW1993847.1 sugar ABC transporter permease [Deltaproteobacteria bacterium]MBW2151996.1 sugar ABC transporter permease [Deltaproteobacteria bacterium]